MQRRRLVHRGVVAALSLLWLNTASAIRRAHPRTPVLGGGRHIVSAALVSISPSAAPGYQMRLVRSEWPPGMSPPTQSLAGTRVVCVGSGAFTIAIDFGFATVWPSQGIDEDAVVLMTPLDPPLVCQQDDCVAFDVDAVARVSSAQSSSDEPAVLWEAHFSPVPLARTWQCGCHSVDRRPQLACPRRPS